MQELRLDIINVNLVVVAAAVLVKLEAHSTLLLTTKVVLVNLTCELAGGSIILYA